jgi:cytochrome P450
MSFDLTDPGLLLSERVLADPRPLYDLLRREAPVWRIPGQDSYLVSDPALIREAVARTSEFSSNLVSVLHREDGARLVAMDLTPYGDAVNTLATADPPIHTKHRRLLQPHLSPAVISELEQVVAGIVEDQLAPMLDQGQGDFVSNFSDPIPGRAICQVLGLPESDAGRLVSLVSGVGALLDGVTDLDGIGQATVAALDLLVYCQEQIEVVIKGESGTRVGLLAVLVDAIDAGQITSDEAVNLMVLLINAGTETTSSLLAASVKTLAVRQDLQERLRADPEAIPQAIEDVLRQDGPFQFHYRWTPTDADLGDVTIPARSRVLLMWAAANRPSPDDGAGQSAVAEDKGQPPHFAFGRGMHFCIGAHLARLEVRVGIERLLARTSGFALDPNRTVTLRPSIFLRRHTSLPVIVTAR